MSTIDQADPRFQSDLNTWFTSVSAHQVCIRRGHFASFTPTDRMQHTHVSVASSQLLILQYAVSLLPNQTESHEAQMSLQHTFLPAGGQTSC